MNQETRNRLIKAVKQLQEIHETTRTYIRARGAYGNRTLYIVDEETGQEMPYEEALLLQPVEGEENVQDPEN